MRSSWLKVAAISTLLCLVLTSPSMACGWLYFPLPGGFAAPASIRAFGQNDIWALGEVGLTNEELWRWNGTAWDFGPTPSPPPGVQYSVDGMSGTSDDDLWLVGDAEENGTKEPLASHFNGTGWTPMTVADPDAHACSPSPDDLVAVQAFSPTDAIAAGLYCTTISGKPIFYFAAVHWNGDRWSVVGRVRAGQFDYAQNGGPTLAASSSSDMWLVGRKEILHFDGARWTRVTPGAVLLTAIFEDTPSDVWAVGEQQTTPKGGFAGASVHWNGSKWSHVRTPDEGFGNNQLFAVTGRGPADAWAFGNYALGNRNRLLSMHWDGTSWSDAPSLGSHMGVFSIAAEMSDGAVWALGARDGQPIAARHCAISP